MLFRRHGCRINARRDESLGQRLSEGRSEREGLSVGLSETLEKQMIPGWLQQKLDSAPKTGDGVHPWLYNMAANLHWHLGPEEIFELLRSKTKRCGRAV